MDKLNIVFMIITIIVIAVIFGAIGISLYNYIDYGTKEGEVIDKQYNRAYTTTEYQTIGAGNTRTSIPIQRYHPESYQIKIQKEDGKELKSIWIEVTPQEYSDLKLGDYYGR